MRWLDSWAVVDPPFGDDFTRDTMPPPSLITPRLLSQHEAATYLGISYWTIRDLVFRRDLPFVKIGRRVLVDRLDLDAYLDRSKIQRGP